MATAINRKFYQDPVFWVLVGAGPVVVLGIKATLPDLSIASLDTVTHALLVLMLYPFLEEVVFRGAVMEAVSKAPSLGFNLSYISFANLIAAVLFSLTHLWGQTWEWALAVFIPGLVFGFAKERWGSLKFPIFLHVFYNGCFFGVSSV